MSRAGSSVSSVNKTTIFHGTEPLAPSGASPLGCRWRGRAAADHSASLQAAWRRQASAAPKRRRLRQFITGLLPQPGVQQMQPRGTNGFLLAVLPPPVAPATPTRTRFLPAESGTLRTPGRQRSGVRPAAAFPPAAGGGGSTAAAARYAPSKTRTASHRWLA